MKSSSLGERDGCSATTGAWVTPDEASILVKTLRPRASRVFRRRSFLVGLAPSLGSPNASRCAQFAPPCPYLSRRRLRTIARRLPRRDPSKFLENVLIQNRNGPSASEVDEKIMVHARHDLHSAVLR